ncbi:alpha/beta fold hydrolase [Nonomuraea polychroma]|uniref:alpha/beta fold hydrolase n=1 Tax=Nonomuraea polychroma TaxID=46176 RepID=UPI003D92BEAE
MTFARAWGAGSAPPVVLVPGFAISGDYLIPTAERLAAMFRVYAPDLPGFGRGDRPACALSVGDLAKALRAWIQVAGVPRPALVANSFGCQVAVELAARRPESVRALVLSSPTIDPGLRSVVRQLVTWVREMRTQSPQLRRIVRRDLLRAGPIRVARTLRHALDDTLEDKLPSVEAPALVVRGTADPMVSRGWAWQVSRLLPRGRFAEIAGAPHAMVHDAPDAFVEAVLPFLHDHLVVSSSRK